jgi:HEAT repeats
MIDKVIALLKDESLEKRIAAAIVLGELRVKSPEATQALIGTLESEVPLLMQHALHALEKTRPAKALAPVLAVLAKGTPEVRQAAKACLAAYGDDALAAVKKRIAEAPPEERRMLDEVLALLGGKDAFSALLASMTSQDAEVAKHAAVSMRSYIKEADAKQRRMYSSETEKFLTKARAIKGDAQHAAILGAVKILGFLEDDRANDTLLGIISDKRSSAALRQEAFIALRFCITGKVADKKLVEALVRAADSDDRVLAQTALISLASLDVAPDAIGKLFGLIAHPDAARARLVMEQIGKRKDKEAGSVLLSAIEKLDRTRAEFAATCLAGNEAVVPELARALCESTSPDKAWIMRGVLRPMAKKVAPALRKQIRELALTRMKDTGRDWEALLDIAREADKEAVQTGLQGLFQKLDKGSKDDRALAVLRVIVKSDLATSDDRAALALRLLRGGTFDARLEARARDESLKALADLNRAGFDVGKLLKKDKKLSEDGLYYVGFHFAETRQPLGQELLTEVVARSPRSKLGKMAKNKLQLTAFSE